MKFTQVTPKFRSLHDNEQRLFIAKILDLVLYNDSIFDDFSLILERAEKRGLIKSKFPTDKNYESK
jgi:hypothetical protein